MVQKFRKKPVVILALQWDGENKLEMLAFCGVYAKIFDIEDDKLALQIVTLEGIMDASVIYVIMVITISHAYIRSLDSSVILFIY